MKKKNNIVYLSGKITDTVPAKQKANMQKFFDKAEELKGMWKEIVNPAEWESNDKLTWEIYLARDLKYIFENKPDLFMLKNWQESKGAKLERALAVTLGLSIYYETPYEGIKK